MKLFHISDTHGLHNQVKVPEGTDIIVHSGDASNNRDPFANLPEFGRFVAWFEALPVEHKIYVPGNHDTAFERRLMTAADLRSRGITVLDETETEIKGLRFFGSPWVPRYGDWAYMVNRDKLHERWQRIPDDAQNVLDYANALWLVSLDERESYALQHPELHLMAWDAGVYQLKHLWRDYHPEKWEEMKKAHKDLAERLREGVYEYGFLKK